MIEEDAVPGGEYYCVTDDPGSKPDQKYARRRDRQNYMGRIK